MHALLPKFPLETYERSVFLFHVAMAAAMLMYVQSKVYNLGVAKTTYEVTNHVKTYTTDQLSNRRCKEAVPV